jgi:hypothetical protein
MSRRPVGYLEEHLPYELGMLDHTLRCLHTTTDQADFNAFLESYCQHARNLKGFITNDKGKGNNSVIARDFVGGFDKSVPRDLTGAFQRINEQTNHLSKKRPTDATEKFTVADARNIAAWIRPAMSEFVSSLDQHDAERWDLVARQRQVLSVTVEPSTPTATNAIQQLTHTTSAGFYMVVVSNG